ncbi:hypothetical protein DCC39_15550 [Pueribacillus theae]|uniref:Nudix hydrolase domain-containing protein n=1 Tax=Pueribacillus theae TaxID=2171751 RepID=A0A2U1JSF8_9BACI|nr:NUDIX hydrolase [Pueribacillus theae]PWA08140.1 hypothetical protein DCC39_15550 [Pueribacillus theae]
MTKIPKPASTVVLVDDLLRVYLTKRPITMKFMGGFHVFPGGSVDLEDNDHVIESEHVRNFTQSEPFSFAYYIAAARELFEEVGILLCSSEDGLPLQFKRKTEMEYRRQLVNKEISFSQMLKQEELHLDLGSLKYFGHRITPEWRPFRFDTRFFLAKLPKDQVPKPDTNEIDEACWIFPDEALLAFKEGKVSMANATVIALQTLINYKEGGPLMMP